MGWGRVEWSESGCEDVRVRQAAMTGFVLA